MLAIDGSMADNIRPALYQVKYSACLVERPEDSPSQMYRVVGKYCESGDELIRSVRLPVVKRGEHLVIPVSGAYQLSMSSNYNLPARPTVLWVENGQVEVLQKAVQAFDDPWWLGAD